MATEIKIEGVESLYTKLDKISQAWGVKEALGKACALVERAAIEKAPKGDTGELRRSIKSEVKDTTGKVYTSLEYAPYVEFGTGLFAEKGGRKDVPWCYQDEKGVWHATKGQHPQPFMRPALNNNRDEILRLLKGGLLND